MLLGRLEHDAPAVVRDLDDDTGKRCVEFECETSLFSPGEAQTNQARAGEREWAGQQREWPKPRVFDERIRGFRGKSPLPLPCTDPNL